MTLGTEFIKQLDAVLGKSVGNIVGKSIIQKQLSRLKKDSNALTSGDCKTLVQNVVNSVGLFVTDQEIGPVKTELEGLFARHFA